MCYTLFVISMKNKKRVLITLLVLMAIDASILAIVLILGGIKDKEINEFYDNLETKACELAKKENYTKELCQGFGYLCKVKYEKLISLDYIDENLKNPITNKSVSEDTKSYIQVTFKGDKIVCEHKEG